VSGHGSCREPDARELEGLLSEVELAIVAATAPEVEGVLTDLAPAEALSVAGKSWWVGELPSSARAVRSVVVVSGFDKVNMAHALTCLLEVSCPKLVIQTGIAGAFASSGLGPGDLAVALSETYADLGVLAPEGWLSADVFCEPLATVAGAGVHNTFPLDPGLVEAAARIFRAGEWHGPTPGVGVGPFLTASQVTGTRDYAAHLERRWGGIAESMEGAAAAHICALYDAPFLEVRGISNLIVDRDRSSWKVVEAAAVACRAALMVCHRLDEVLVARRAAGDEDEIVL
jgi:futalosine hydrolase